MPKGCAGRTGCSTRACASARTLASLPRELWVEAHDFQSIGEKLKHRSEEMEPGRGFEPRTPSLPWRCSAC